MFVELMLKSKTDHKREKIIGQEAICGFTIFICSILSALVRNTQPD